MSDINPLLQWLNANPNFAGIVTFLVAASESIAIIGTIIPGSVTMTVIGTLAGSGVIPLWSAILWAIVGAAVGDNFSYWIGHRFKNHLPQRWPFRSHPQLLKNGEAFFQKYGMMSVFIGRFIGPVRALVPLVAGMLGMRAMRYVPISLLASIFWAPAYMLPGILLGKATLEFPPDIAVHVLLTFVLGCLLVILAVWLIVKFFLLVRYQVNQFLNYLWAHMQASRYFNIWTKLLKHHDRTQTHGQLTLAFYFLLTSFAFTYLAVFIYYHESVTVVINKIFFFLFRSWRSPAADDVMLVFTLLGDKTVLLPVIAVVIAWFAYSKRWYTALHAFILTLMTCASISILKVFLHSSRPWGITNSPETFSFPSGHTTLSTVFYLGLGMLLIHFSKAKFKNYFYCLIVLLVAAISISRLYLGAHWTTDIIGGWLLSAALLMLIALSYNRHYEKPIAIRKTIIITLLALIVSFTFQFVKTFDTLKHNYTRQDWPTRVVSYESWWQQKGGNLPLYRVGRIGFKAEVFNLQWVGNINEIRNTLMQQGWEMPPKSDWINALHRISDVSSAEHLPLVLPLYLDNEPVLVLIKHVNQDKPLTVLRLWNSNLYMDGTNIPLWVGSIGLAPRTYSWLISYKKRNVKLEPSLVFTTIPSQYDIKIVEMKLPIKNKHGWQTKPVILIKPKDKGPA